MKPFVPENPPLLDSQDGLILAEYLARQFQKISQSLGSLRPDGYGGIQLNSPVIGTGVLPVTPTKIPGSVYDSVITDNPSGVEQDLPNGRIRVLHRGLWLMNGVFTGLIDAITANDSNRINLAPYNETDGQLGDQPGFFTVPRYGDAFDVGFVALINVDENLVNKWFGLYTWAETATPSINITDILSLEFSVSRVG